MEDNETFEHINQWEPGSSVLPSIPNEEQIGSVQKQLSGTLVKQKLEADQGTFTQDLKKEAELQHAKQKAGLQTKDLPKDQEECSNSTELPSGLMNDILSLREDFPIPEEDCIDLKIKGLIQTDLNKSNQQPDAKTKTFDEAAGQSKAFDPTVLNICEGVEFPDKGVKNLDETSVSIHVDDFSLVKEKGFQGFKKLGDNVSIPVFSIKPSIAKGCASLGNSSASIEKGSAFFASGSAIIEKGNATGSASIDEGNVFFANESAPFGNGSASIDNGSTTSFANGNAFIDEGSPSFAYYSASIDKGIASIDKGSASIDKGSASIDKGSASIDKGSASIDKGKFASGNTGDLEGPAESAVNTILCKLAEPDGLGNPAKQGYGFNIPFTTSQTSSCITNQPNVQMTHTQPLRNASGHFHSTGNPGRATQFQTGVSAPMSSNLTMPDSANASPMANQNISAQSTPNTATQPEPPDTHYTCSPELKHALKLKFLPFRPGQMGQNFQSSGTAYGQRQHPYTRPEASSTGEFQTSLPNLPEFMKNLF